MNEENPRRKIEDIPIPELTAPAHQAQIKLTLLNSSRSSRLGIILVCLPCIFIFGIFLKYDLRLQIGWLTAVEEWMSRFDHTPFWFVIPLLLVGAPLLALALNLLAIMHVQLDRERDELQISLKLKFANLFICAVSTIILASVFVHIIGERG